MVKRVVQSPVYKSALKVILSGANGIYSRNTILQFYKQQSHYSLILETMPNIGAYEPLLQPYFGKKYRRIVIAPYFKIIYSIRDKHILLEDIWDTRRDPEFLVSHIK